MPALEDKIVQSAVAEVLSAVYEADFLGFSYGFRPGGILIWRLMPCIRRS
ncbi:reverse transcriptase/maturase family protein [Bradyrhizobium diazoefficiens]|uniref:Reverse transcriptase/maturase family protein n=1 Tax=Bradyrhizobium diazoefficiens TaxID=1355477 RepID=A0A0E4BM70_9BRAD|nr:reverse transcriptase/maturase family protein [Bradyrhizobium diazoefficiens]